MSAIATLKPQRVQRKRSRGWRMPDNTTSVCRPGTWGNPFVVTTKIKPGNHVGGAWYIAVPTAEDAVECYRLMIEQKPEMLKAARDELRGRNLACFCKIGDPCHGDVLLEIANAPA